MIDVLCLCDEIPKFRTRSLLLVVMHWRERLLTSNSAKFACMAIEGSQWVYRGNPDKPFVPTDDPERHSLILFPTPESVPLTRELLDSIKKPIRLIVPDGSWRQARKVTTRTKEWRDYTHVKIDSDLPSNYALRKRAQFGQFCTLEAIAEALRLMESDQVADELLLLLTKLTERTLWSRGELKTQDATTGIPDQAILWAKEAGRQKS